MKRLLFLSIVLILAGCSLTDDDTSFADEDMAGSMSMDEGGTLYVADTATDITNETSSYDSNTFYYTVTGSVNTTNVSGTVYLNAKYQFRDASGNPQSAYNPDTTDQFVVEIISSTSFDRPRHKGSMTCTNNFTITGMSTNSTELSVNGTTHIKRTSQSKTRNFSSEMTLTHSLSDLKIRKSDRMILSGSAHSSYSGTVNNRSFSREADWTFQEGYNATLTLPSGTVTVDIQSGEY